MSSASAGEGGVRFQSHDKCVIFYSVSIIENCILTHQLYNCNNSVGRAWIY